MIDTYFMLLINNKTLNDTHTALQNLVFINVLFSNFNINMNII